MNPIPDNRMLFWACHLGGTLGLILGTFLINLGRRPHEEGRFAVVDTLVFRSDLADCICMVRQSDSVRRGREESAASLPLPLGWLARASRGTPVGYTVVHAI